MLFFKQDMSLTKLLIFFLPLLFSIYHLYQNGHQHILDRVKIKNYWKSRLFG